MFNTESESMPSAYLCAPVTNSVQFLPATFSNFKLNASVGMRLYKISVTRAILDTVAGLDLVRESFLPQNLKKFRKLLRFKCNIVDANCNHMLHLGKIYFTVKFGNFQLRTSFYVVENYPFRIYWDVLSFRSSM